jgi:molybdopterin synthase sulfur carrier subunit
LRVKVLLFGVLADKARCSSLDFENVNDLNELNINLKAKFLFLEKVSYAIAVNQLVVNGNIKLNDNDEIAFLPPFAGG